MTTWVNRHAGKLCLLAGALLPFAFAPVGAFPLSILCIAWLFHCLDAGLPDTRPWRTATWRAFAFGVGTYVTGAYWLYTSLHTFGGAPLFVALPLMAGLVALMSLWPALMAYGVVRFGPPPGMMRWLVALPAGWCLAEWCRGWILGGLGWLSLGYSQSDSPLSGFAPVVGVLGMGWAVAVTAGALVTLVRGRRASRIAAVLVVITVWGTGYVLDQQRWTQAEGDSLQVGIVQGAVPQDKKWLREQLVPTLQLYRDLTGQHWDKDLIVWPEAAIPALRSRVSDFFDQVRAEAVKNDTDLLIGFVDYVDETGQYLNGVMSLGKNSTDYYKRHLVPFGEFFPVPGFIRNWMRLQNLPYRDYTRGGDDQRPLEAAGVPIAATICYEDVFGHELLWALPATTLTVNVSNDAWFGSSIAPHQHLQIARLRAMESGRYQLRSTNTGITAIIDDRGAVQARLPQFEAGVLSGTVQPMRGLTPYARGGNVPIVVFSLLMLGLGMLLKNQRNA